MTVDEIEKRWQVVGVVSPAQNEDIQWLLSHCRELEAEVADWKAQYEDERHSYHKMWARVNELEEAIEKHKQKEDDSWIQFKSHEQVKFLLAANKELYAVLEKK